MKYFWYLGVALLLLLTGVQAQADTFKFDFNDGPTSTIFGSGTLDAVINFDGTFTVTSGSGIFTDPTGTRSVSLFMNPYPYVPNTPTTSPSGAFLYNNVLYPASNPFLDNWGLLFTYGLPPNEINIWGNGSNLLYNYYVYDPNQGYTVTSVSINFNLVPVPEPSTTVFLGISVLSLVGLRRRWKE